MPRFKGTEKKIRLNLEMAASVRHDLEELQVRIRADTLTEVIRRAIGIYSALVDAELAGENLILRDKRGNEKAVILCGLV